jgi:Flp pilus assembly protein TadD
MAKHQLFASLTLVSIVLAAASSTHAELAPNINSLTIKKIERATTATNRRTSTPSQQLTSAAEYSMRYVQMGRAAQKRGANKDALILFHKAVKLDKTNAYAFMAAGDLLGDREEGITCMRAAVKLFGSQRNQEGYDLATGWLEERGIDR